MSRNRCEKLKINASFQCSCKCQPKDSLDYITLFKVKPLINRIRKNFLKIEVKECHVVVEMIISFQDKSFSKNIQGVSKKCTHS